MEKTTIYLIRHGEAERPRDTQGTPLIYGPNVPLNDEGKKQIQQLTGILERSGVEVKRIYTSPYQRARESTQLLKEKLGNPDIIELEGLRDVDNPHAIGLPWDFPVKGDSPVIQTPGRETNEQVVDRMTTAFCRICEEERDNTVAIVSHGDPIRLLVYKLENPKGLIPSMVKLNKYDYLSTGEAWILTLTDEGHLLSKGFLTTREQRSIRREREN